MRLFRNFATVGGLTMLSRILGFVREKLIAFYLGAGDTADIWFVAFRFPNLFRRIFGEGAFNMAFVPMYTRRLEEDGNETADRFASKTLSLMALVLGIIFALSLLFMEPIVRLIADGFEPEKLELAVDASRITTAYLVFVCLMAAFSGILNSRKSFFAPALSYALLNVVLIAALAFYVPKAENPLTILSWSLVLAGVLQLAVVVFDCFKKGVRIRPAVPRLDGDMKRLGFLMLPGLATAGIQQLNLLVGQSIATGTDGGVSWIQYADRVNQLPLGIIGIAAGVVLLPEITRHLRGGRESEARQSMARGIEMALLLTLPAAIALAVFPRHIVHAIFEGGEFSADHATEAGKCLAAFAIGTPAYVLARVLQPGYFARENTRTPMYFTFATAIVNIALCFPLYAKFGPAGCALATSIAGFVNLGLFWVGLRKLGFLELARGFFTRFFRLIIAAAGMGLAVWFMARQAEPWLLGDGNFWIRLAVLAAVSFTGMLIYFALVFLTRAYRLSEVKALIRRKQN